MTQPLDLTFSWASPKLTSPGQPQNRTLPTWGAIGSPDFPYPHVNPYSPLTLARKAVGYSGIAGLGGLGGTQYPEVPLVLRLASLGAFCGLVYHGYKRNRGSVGWALVWGLLGGIVWPITLPIALAQGFAKPKAR